MTLSLAEQYALLDPGSPEKAAFDAEFFPTERAFAARAHDWSFWGRPEQIWRPGPERTTAYIAGRGWGKGMAASHAAHYLAMHPELCGGRKARGPDDHRAGQGAFIGIAGRTANDRNQTLIDGDSGIMNTCDPRLRPEWRKSDGLLIWPTGVRGRLISGEEPDTARGPNLGAAILDELAHYAKAEEVWKQVNFALRKASRGQHPRCIVTTTPLGTRLIQSIVFELRDGAPVRAEPGDRPDRVLQGFKINPRTRVVTGSSYDNWANLDDDFRTSTLGQYEGTADGDQEIHALIRLGTPGALWVQDWYQRCEDDQVPRLDRIAVFVDPSVSDGVRVKGSDEVCECGIVGAGLVTARRKIWALRDASLVARPRDWADVVVRVAVELGAAEIVAEDNNGGGLVREAVEAAWLRRRGDLAQARKPVIALVRATRNKTERAAFAAPAWESGKVVHVGPARRWVSLERQQTTYDPNRPHDRQQTDRMDAASWMALHFLGDGSDRTRVSPHTTAEAWLRVADAMGRRR